MMTPGGGGTFNLPLGLGQGDEGAIGGFINLTGADASGTVGDERGINDRCTMP